MAYQNNNNRVVPKETVNAQLNPVAAPTNQEIKYQVDLSQAKQTAANADALAKIGQGVLDIDYTLNRKAQESIIDAEMETFAEGGNQREWADVSKNVRGMAKFNPYIKDAFKDYLGKDIYTSATLKLQSNPNVLNGKMSVEEYHKFKTDTVNEMLTAYNEAGLKPNIYSKYVEKLYDDIYKTDEKYLTNNAQYTYNNSLTAMAHDTAIRLGANTYTATNETEKIQGLITAFQETIDTANTLGIPSDEIVSKVLGVGLSEYLVNNAEKVNSATVVAALKDIKVNGKALNEIIPNFDYRLQTTIKQIKNASYEDRLLEWNNQQLTLKIDSENATKEFFSWYKKNQNATPEQIQEQALGLISKYNIDADGAGFLTSVSKTRGLMYSLKATITDPTTYNELTAKAVTGLLTGVELGEAVSDGLINPDDAIKLQNKMEAVEKQGATEFKQRAGRILDSYITKSGANYKETPPDVRNSINSTITQIQGKLDRGEITASEAQAKLNQLEIAIPNMLFDRQIQNRNYRIIMDGRYRNTQNIPSANRQQAQQAIVRMGLLRNTQGVRDTNVSIISPQSNDRDGQKHIGNDLSGAWIGRAVYAPSSGRIIASGYEGTMGNYALFQDNRGKYALYMHLQNPVKTGSIDRNTAFGYVGNTGRVSNKNTGCLHVEFWNQNLQVVRPEEW